jgi:DsbC/DsbD-like thiol-disulfide interchange protein
MSRLISIAILITAYGCGTATTLPHEPDASGNRPASVSSDSPKHEHASPGATADAMDVATTIPIEVPLPTAETPVTVGAAVEPPEVHPGEVTTLIVRARIAPGWHIYGLDTGPDPAQPTQIRLDFPEDITGQGDWTAPSPATRASPLGMTSVYESEVNFKRQLKVAASPSLRSYHLPLQFIYQACDDAMCMPPTRVSLNVPLQILPQAE